MLRLLASTCAAAPPAWNGSQANSLPKPLPHTSRSPVIAQFDKKPVSKHFTNFGKAAGDSARLEPAPRSAQQLHVAVASRRSAAQQTAGAGTTQLSPHLVAVRSFRTVQQELRQLERTLHTLKDLDTHLRGARCHTLSPGSDTAKRTHHMVACGRSNDCVCVCDCGGRVRRLSAGSLCMCGACAGSANAHTLKSCPAHKRASRPARLTRSSVKVVAVCSSGSAG